jgi:chromosome segregation ATPase
VNRAFQCRESLSISLIFCSSLADAVKVMSLSNSRRVKLEMNLDEAKSQLRDARAKDFNAGRLFRLEIENADLHKQIDLYKVALEEARQLLLNQAHQSHVDLPQQLETLRRDLRSTDAALLSAQASRDEALKELEKLRFQFDAMRLSTETERRRFSCDNVALRSKLASLPDLIRSSSGAVDSRMCESASSNFASIFKTTRARRSSLISTDPQ